MNISNLRTIFDNGSDYYLVQKDDSIILCFIECGIESKEFEDLTLKELSALDNQVLDKNIYLNSNFPPFQEGLTVGRIDCLYPLMKAQKEVIKELKLKEEDVVIPFIGGIGFDYKDMLIKWLNIKEKMQCWKYESLFREEVKKHLIERIKEKGK